MTPELRYGLAAGVGMGLWLLLEYALGLHTRYLPWSDLTHWVTELILLVALWRLLHHRITVVDRAWMSAWRGTVFGAGASLVASMVLYMFAVAYVFFIHPDWPDLMLHRAVAEMRAGSVPEEEIRAYARFIRQCFTPGGLAAFILSVYTLGGGLASAVLTLALNWRLKKRGVID